MKKMPRPTRALAGNLRQRWRPSMHRMDRRWLLASKFALMLAMVLLGVVHPAAARADAAITTDSALNTMWNTYGNQGGHWTGGDSTVSVALPDGRIVWLFSDTFLGTVNSDFSRPSNTPFIRNSMVVQQGSTLTTITGGTASAPTSLVQAVTNSSTNWDWVDDAFLANNQLEVFYTQYQPTGSGPLDFQQVATAIAIFSLPSLSLQSVTQLNVGTTLNWGATVLVQSTYTYIYGIETAVGNKFLHLARAPSGQVLTTGSNPTTAWQFWTGSSWSANESDSGRIMSGAAGVSIAQINGQYVLVTQDTAPGILFDPNLVAYTASSPTGPFGHQVYLYQPPEATGNDIAYSPQIHPELDSAGTLVLSYNVNGLQSGADYADARIYRPRFLDLTWPVAAPNPATQPAAPTALSITSDGQGIHLSWTASSTSGVSYWVYQQDLTSGQTQPARLTNPITSGTMFSTANLVNGDTYQFSVTAYDSAGESPHTTTVSAVPAIQAPTAAPANLTATANSDGTISLHWGAVSGPDVYYNVYQRDDTIGQTNFIPWNTPVSNGTSVVARSLTDGHQYEFEVSAVNPGGEGPLSAPVTAVAHALAPAAPTGLTATANSDGTISLAWTAPAPNLWYWIYFKDVSAGQATFTRSVYPVSTGPSFTLSYLTIGDVYAFYVTAISASGESAPSNTVQATPSMPPPGAPTGLTATANSDGTIALAWTAPAPNLWYWIYFEDTTAGQTTYTRSAYPVTTGPSFTLSYLTLGDVYNFYVTAINAGGESAPSNTVQATPSVPPPGAPTDLDAAAGNGKVLLSWTAPAPKLWYWIYYCDTTHPQTNQNCSTLGTYTRTAYPVTSGTSFTLSYLTNGDTYEFYVTAINAGGEGPASNTAQATPSVPPPGAPTNLDAAAGNAQVALSWTAPTGSGLLYWIYYCDVSHPQTNQNCSTLSTYTRTTDPVSVTSFTLSYLTNGDTYKFYVTAVNSGGESSPSNIVLATPMPPLPAAPTGMGASANNNGTIALSWTAPGSGLAYWIYFCDVTAGQNCANLSSFTRSTYPVTTTSFTMSYLTVGHTYKFYVTAANLAGEGPASTIAQATSYMPPPAAPTLQTADGTDLFSLTGLVHLVWTAPAPNLYYWIYFRDDTQGQTKFTTGFVPVSGTSFDLSYLIMGDTYEFYVTAANAGGQSQPSNIRKAQPLPPKPQAPQGLKATVLSGATCQCDPSDPGAWEHRVDLSWDGTLLPGVWYTVWYRDTSAGGGWVPIPYVLGLSLSVTPLTAFHTYQFVVQAFDVAGASNINDSSPAWGTPWAQTYGWVPYSPPRIFAWNQISPVFWIAFNIDCDAFPGLPDGYQCTHYIQFKSAGGERYFAVNSEGDYTYSFTASAAFFRTQDCKGASAPDTYNCTPWDDWQSDDMSFCANLGYLPVYGMIVGCYQYLPWLWYPS